MDTVTSQTKRFFIASRVAKLHALEQLASNCKLITIVCKLIHELQKERGLGNVYLASSGEHFAQERDLQIQQSSLETHHLSQFLHNSFIQEQLKRDNHALLLSISLSLQGLDELTRLRRRVSLHKVSPLQNTKSYCRLINLLLDIVYEAGDLLDEQSFSKSLIALINFLQAKEYAGQERAWGAIGFAEKAFSADIYKRILDLQTAQQKSIALFENYAYEAIRQQWQQKIDDGADQEVNRLRKMIAQFASAKNIKQARGSLAMSSDISEIWYEVVTKRIEVMHVIEQSLIDHILSLAQSAIKDIASQLKQGDNFPNTTKDDLLKMNDISVKITEKTQFYIEMPLKSAERHSVYGVLYAQSQKIDIIQKELVCAQIALQEQQKISRAKLLLIQQNNMSEDKAHKWLRKAAMDQQVSMQDIAEKIIALSLTNKGTKDQP